MEPAWLQNVAAGNLARRDASWSTKTGEIGRLDALWRAELRDFDGFNASRSTETRDIARHDASWRANLREIESVESSRTTVLLRFVPPGVYGALVSADFDALEASAGRLRRVTVEQWCFD